MDIRQLRVLRLVLDTGSVSEAARLLNISQPAVSKTIALVESEMDLRLFERVQGRLIPTTQVHALCSDIDRLLADLASVKQTVRELRDGKRGQVKIAATPTVTASVLPAAIASFRKSNPSVEFVVVATSTPNVVGLVARNEVELGACQPSSGDPYVESTDLCRGDVLCLMPVGHPLSRLKRVRPADLAAFDLISFTQSEPTGARIAEAFRSEGLRFRVSVEVNQSLTACSLVESGLGIGLIDSFFPLGTSFPNIVARPFSPTIPIRVQIMSSQQRLLSPLASAFRDELRATAKQWCSQNEAGRPMTGKSFAPGMRTRPASSTRRSARTSR
jgi:DNA-binding transcriptional LysR family regulator